MNFWSSLTFTFLLCLLVSWPSGSDARTCVFQCMRSVIACKRKATVGKAVGACCEDYYKCFLGCKPDATNLPPCTSSPNKRTDLDERILREGEMRLPENFNEFL